METFWTHGKAFVCSVCGVWETDAPSLLLTPTSAFVARGRGSWIVFQPSQSHVGSQWWSTLLSSIHQIEGILCRVPTHADIFHLAADVNAKEDQKEISAP